MTTLNQLKSGLAKAWDNVTEGWHELVERAGGALTRFDPRQSADQLETRAEQRVARGSHWSLLAAEVSFDDKAVEVCIEIPGMEADDFSIEVVDDVLVVRGEKKYERIRGDGRYHIAERAYGAFERAVALPVGVDEAGASARYRRGVLRVRLPRSETSRVRRIPVGRK